MNRGRNLQHEYCGSEVSLPDPAQHDPTRQHVTIAVMD
jgi:hypothetical protein